MDMKDLFAAGMPVFLHSIQVPKELVTLVLAPHPDDFDEIGITMRFFKDNGNLIYVAVLSSGASGVEDGFCSAPTRKAKGEIRESEQRESCTFFGLPESHLSFLRLEEDHMGDIIENEVNVDRVRDHFLQMRPDVVFLPHGNDTNIDHHRTYSIFRRIASGAGYSITAFLNRDPKTISMRHDVYTVFGEKDAEWKGQLLRFHESQQQRNLNTRNHGLDERVLRVNRTSAQENLQMTTYAEVFELEFFRQDSSDRSVRVLE
ncbi:MAG: PIG-L family deacetylase [candidate division NC10 bacterium]|nr:PIG-L family deacetylase [candidate division NC10 bacterium]